VRLLMCPPVYYGIEYEINPWMNLNCRSESRLAQDQWWALYQLLNIRLGVDIALAEPKPGLPDMVFTANAGFLSGNKFIASNFRYDVRRGEAIHFENWFAARNYEICHLPQESYFEGEGDLLMCGDVLFAGHPYRSSLVSHEIVAETLQREIISLRLINDWFYHLDTCLCPLDNHRALIYRGAFDSSTLSVLESKVDTLISVNEEEARRFACNAIVVEKNVIINEGCPKTRDQLESRGFSVFEVPLSEFIKAGGSAKCLVLTNRS
jgi:N-dimethylarginine dimethylaminohydrolase